MNLVEIVMIPQQLRQYLNKDINLILDDEGNNLLMVALYNNAPLDTVKLILDSPIDINYQNKIGQTALHMAVFRHNNPASILLVLLHKKLNANLADAEGIVPLTYILDKPEIVKAFIRAKADINVSEQYDRTPLSIAVALGYFETVKLLIEAGANTDIIDSDGNTLLHMAANKSIWNVLVAHGLDILAQNKLGQSLLHSAVAFEDIESVKKILQSPDTNVNEFDNIGNTPLILAAYKYNYEIIELLVKHGANINATNSTNSNVLHIISYDNNNLEVVKFLVEHGIDYDFINTNGQRPIDLFTYIDISTYLISIGANISSRFEDFVNFNNTVNDAIVKNAEINKKWIYFKYIDDSYLDTVDSKFKYLIKAAKKGLYD